MRSSSRSDSEPESDEEWGGLRKKAGEKTKAGGKGSTSTGIRNGVAAKGSLSDSDDDFDV